MSERYQNQRGLLDEAKIRDTSFVVIGAGAIGSFVVTALAKMGAKNITVYDADTLEDHNIDNQMYPIHYVGKRKVEALQTVASAYGDCTITPISEFWSPSNARDANVVISCVDNMDVRGQLWNYYKDRPGCSAFFDGRMSAFVYRVFSVLRGDSSEREHYESTLHPQAESEPERCGQKSIIFTVLGVSCGLVSLIKQYLMNDYRPVEMIVDMHNHTIMKTYKMDNPAYANLVEEPEVEEVERAESVGV